MVAIMLSFWCATIFVCGQGATGAANPHVPAILVWAIGGIGLAAFIFACVSSEITAGVRHALSFIIGGVLLALGAITWGLNASSWLPFCTLSGAVCFLGVVVAELIWSPRDRGTMAPADADPNRYWVSPPRLNLSE
jgi:hypothetical protein